MVTAHSYKWQLTSWGMQKAFNRALLILSLSISRLSLSSLVMFAAKPALKGASLRVRHLSWWEVEKMSTPGFSNCFNPNDHGFFVGSQKHVQENIVSESDSENWIDLGGNRWDCLGLAVHLWNNGNSTKPQSFIPLLGCQHSSALEPFRLPPAPSRAGVTKRKLITEIKYVTYSYSDIIDTF